MLPRSTPFRPYAAIFVPLEPTSIPIRLTSILRLEETTLSVSGCDSEDLCLLSEQVIHEAFGSVGG